MNNLKIFLALILCFWSVTLVQAHEGHGTKKKAATPADTVKSVQEARGADPAPHAGMEMGPDPGMPPAHDHGQSSWDEFPTLHPLVVHFPIMFLLIAALTQLVQFFVFRRELSWVVFVLLILGFIGAYVAGRYVHPHTDGLTERAAQILKEHDLYADWTVWLSGVGMLLKGLSHFALHRKVWAEAVVAVVLLGAAYAVAMAGHHGAQLVHIEGVGPQGKFLELEHGH